MRFRISILAGGCLLFLSGCALQSQLVDLESGVAQVQQDLQQVRSNLEAVQKKQTSEEGSPLQRRVEAMENYLKEKTPLLQKSQADSGVRLDQLNADLQLIQGKLEENNHLLTELSQRLDEQSEAQEDLSRRVVALEARRNADSPQSKMVFPGGEPEPVKPSPETKEVRPAPSDLYNAAYRDYLQGNYDLALTGFSTYLQQYPAGSLAPNSQYWIGECYYSKKDYANAVEAFEKVSVQYPKNEKVPSALLKAGYAYIELGNNELSKTYLKRVVEQFPYSREATMAKVRLSELK